MDKMLIDKMTINLNVFGLFMKDIIVSNLNGTSIITIKRNEKDVDIPKSLRSYPS